MSPAAGAPQEGNPRSWTGRAVLFDSDGVLVDSTAAIEESWTRWADEHGLAPLDVLPRIHGRPAAAAIAELIAPGAAAAALERIEAIEVGGAPGTRPIAGAIALAESLAGARWAIVTSGSRRLATARLAAAGLPAPPVLVCVEDAAAGKPSPAPYLAAARALGVPARECLVFEDTPSGAAAGHAAGAEVVGVGAAGFAALAHVADLRSARVTRVGADRLRLDLLPGPAPSGERVAGQPVADGPTINP